MKKAVVLGAGGFIGTHLVTRLREEGYYVRGVDLKYPEWTETDAHEFIIGDLMIPDVVNTVLDGGWDEVYQLAADMGGAEYIFTGANDLKIMVNNLSINLNVVDAVVKVCDGDVGKLFFSSSACVYPFDKQLRPDQIDTEESAAYPAFPDSEYGWEKLMSERLYLQLSEITQVKIARFHNIFGPLGTWEGNRAKAPAALCRKVAMSEDIVKIIGDGKQTRSFLYIDHCILAIKQFMEKENFSGPVNIGSEEMVSINELAQMIIDISGKYHLELSHETGPDAPVGVRARNSDNRLFEKHMDWSPDYPLRRGLKETYKWIHDRI